MMGASGDAAAYTGDRCVQAAGDAVDDDCVVLANLVALGCGVEDDGSFAAARGALVERLLGALHAAEDAGGDIRVRRSAAVTVVRSRTTGRPWHDTVVDLRIDDSPQPVHDLDALVEKRARYQDVVRAFELALDGNPVAADRQLEHLRPQDPSVEPDQVLWRAVVAALAGREDLARVLLAQLGSTAPQFLAAARRFASAALIPGEILDRILPDRLR